MSAAGRWWMVEKVIHRGEARWIIVNKRTGGAVDRGGKRPGPLRFRSSADAAAYVTRRWTKHKEKSIRHPITCPDGAYIDEKIVPLIRLTWALGIKTEMCCQNCPPPRAGGGPVSGRWVMVKLSSVEAVRWFQLVKSEDWACWDTQWHFGAYPRYPDGKGISIFIYFRWRQLPGVLARLRAALKVSKVPKGTEGFLPLAGILR